MAKRPPSRFPARGLASWVHVPPGPEGREPMPVLLIARWDGDVEVLKEAYDRAHRLIMERGGPPGELRHHCAVGGGGALHRRCVGVRGTRPGEVRQHRVRRRPYICGLPPAIGGARSDHGAACRGAAVVNAPMRGDRLPRVALHRTEPLFSRRGEVAQLAEHATENRGVDSSILSLATGIRALSPRDRGLLRYGWR